MKHSFEKFVAWSVVSEFLTGSRHKIRKDYIQEKYQDQIKELEILVNYWIEKNTPKNE